MPRTSNRCPAPERALCKLSLIDSNAERPTRRKILMMKTGDISRFWKKVRKSQGCWGWLGCHFNTGRPAFWLNRNNVLAYRVVFLLTKGNIAQDLVIDHLCDNPACMNPDHMKVATQRENLLRSNNVCARNKRKLLCKRGHELSPLRTVKYANRGWRECRICKRELQRICRQGYRERLSERAPHAGDATVRSEGK